MERNNNNENWGGAAAAASELCFNCSIPIYDDDDDHQLKYNFAQSQFEDAYSRTSTVYEVPSSSSSSQYFSSSTGFERSQKVKEIILINSSENGTTTTKLSVGEALSVIFKLDYLNVFNHHHHVDATGRGQEDEGEDLSLCQPCSEILAQLYSLYNCFLQIQKVDSSLSNRIRSLDEIIESHQRGMIYCDLISGSLSEKKNNPITSTTIMRTRESTPNDAKTDSCSSIIFGPEPRIMLTRLVLSSNQQEQIANIKKERTDLEFDDDSIVVDSPLYFDGDAAQDDCDDLLSIKAENSDQAVQACTNVTTTTATTITKVDIIVETLNRKRESSQLLVNEEELRKKSKAFPKRIIPPSFSKLNQESNPSMDEVSSSSSDSDDECLETKKNRLMATNMKKMKKRKPKGKRRRRTVTMTTAGSSSKKLRAPNKHPRYKSRRFKVPNPCWYCALDFPTPDLLCKHTEEEHLPDNRRRPRSAKFHICPRCSKICCAQKRLRRHLLQCETIPYGVVLPSPFQCTECSKSFPTERNLKTHMETHTFRSFPCKICEFQSKSAYGLSLHTRNIHSNDEAGLDASVKCDECDRVLKNDRRLKMHQFKHHSDLGRQRYQVEKGKYLAKKREETKQRQTVSTCTVCYECNIDFFTHNSLVVHQKSCHLDKLQSMFVCESCGKSFTGAKGLKRHLKSVHGGERPYLCPQCGKDFKTSHNLYTHERQIHTIEGKLRYSAYMRDLKRRKKQVETQLASGPPLSLPMDLQVFESITDETDINTVNK